MGGGVREELEEEEGWEVSDSLCDVGAKAGSGIRGGVEGFVGVRDDTYGYEL